MTNKICLTSSSIFASSSGVSLVGYFGTGMFGSIVLRESALFDVHMQETLADLEPSSDRRDRLSPPGRSEHLPAHLKRSWHAGTSLPRHRYPKQNAIAQIAQITYGEPLFSARSWSALLTTQAWRVN